MLLAEIVSRVSGSAIEDFLAQRILKPLGMANSGFAVSGLARAYAPIEEGGLDTAGEGQRRTRLERAAVDASTTSRNG